MKRLLIILLCVLLLAVAAPVSANAFSAWSNTSGCWTATNDTYTLVMWNATGTSSWSPPVGVTSVDYLVVAGGGGGGLAYGGGGGAGQIISGSGLSVSGSQTITVGVGGNGQPGDSTPGTNGGDSSISALVVSKGGGFGVGNVYGNTNPGANGGSGGGARSGQSGGSVTSGTVPAGGTSYGNVGLGNAGSDYAGGGGGGAGAAGTTGTGNTAGGNGGAGITETISGSSLQIGGGGAGDGTSTFGTASHGGGSNAAGTANTGGGGGSKPTTGGSGGSGIVIISYQTPGAPVANFTSNTTSGYAPLTVQFNDTSSNTPTSWQWNATNVTGNNTPFTFSTTQNATQTFGTGNYTIKLSATNAGGSNVSSQTTWINVSAATVALSSNFSPNSSVGYQSPWAVRFNDTSLGTPVTWNWTFGDGRTSTDQNPVYIYTVANNYTVTLNVTSSTGSFSNTSKYVELRTDDDIYLKSWSHFNSSPIVDEKGNAWSINGATISTSVKKFGAGSLAITTDDDRISSVSSTVWDLNGFNWEMEFNIYPVSQGSAAKNLISRTTGTGTGTTSGWGFRNNGSSAGYSFWMGNIANETPRFSLTNNAWTHVKIYRDHDEIEVYKDGIKVVASTPQPGSYDIAQPLLIGYKGPGADNYFYLDEFRFTQGISREVGNFTTPYAAYNGNLYQNYVNINPNATFRYKTNPGGYAVVYNQTGPRSRTVQVQNITNATMINGSVNYQMANMLPTTVILNNTIYGDMTLNSYNIDSTNGIVSFSVSRAAGIKALFDNRTDLVDIPIAYIEYTAEPEINTYFSSGSLTDSQHSVTYPITNFIGTNVSLGQWDFYPNFTSNVTSALPNQAIQFNDTTVGYPNLWNWSWGDGNWSNGTSQTPTYAYVAPGLYTVAMSGMLSQNTSVVNTSTKVNYITINTAAPVSSFTTNSTGGIGLVVVQLTDTSYGSPTSWQWNATNVTGNNTPFTLGTSQNITQSFGVGNFSLSLNVTNAGGSNTSIQKTWVNVSQYPPVIVFSANQTVGYNYLPVQFTDASTNGPISWNWSFGDGSYATTQNPFHNYTSVGSFDVGLTATNLGGSNTSTKIAYIQVALSTPPQANFMASTTYGGAPLTVVFTDLSTNIPTSWNWSFGDGSYDTTQSPSHIFTNPGLYSISLNATNVYGSNSTTKSGYINVGFKSVSNFTAEPISGAAPLLVNFTDASQNATSWAWDFTNDGTNDTIVQNPSYTYYSSGTYSVRLTTNNTYGGNVTIKTNYVTVGNIPGTNFVGTPRSGTTPLVVAFNDTTTNGPTSWNWSFGDGTVSNLQNVSHTYTAPGTYSVNLTATNAYGSIALVKTDYISTAYPATSGFSATPLSGITPLSVTFTDESQNATSWAWDFNNDGTNESTVQNPSYTYNSVGTYTVKQYVMNALSSDTTTKINYVTAGNLPGTYFTGTPRSGATPLTVVFTDGTTNSPTSWSWTFGDGGVSSLQNPTHSYTSPGTYTINLTATNAYGSYTQSRSGYISTGYTPTAGFSALPLTGVAPQSVTFTDASLNATSWAWDFNNDGINESTAQNPTYSYNSPGTYSVKQYVTNLFGSDSLVKNAYITIGAVPVVGFSALPTAGALPLVVNFTDSTSSTPSAISWTWDFGDGATSTAQNPSHTYAANGAYTVVHTATNSYGTGSLTRAGYIVVSNDLPIASFTMSTGSGNTPLIVQFTSTSVGQIPLSYSWNFGDGGTSTSVNPTHTFSNTGTFTVTLVVTNSLGSSTTSGVVTVFKQSGGGGTTPTLCADMHTDVASNVTSRGMTLTGHTNNTGNTPVWFLWGLKSNTYSVTTRSQNVTSPAYFNTNITSGFYPGKTVYYRAGSACGYGEELSFVVPSVTMIPTPTFGEHLQALEDSNLDPGILASELPQAFTQQMGASEETGTLIFWGFCIMCLFIVLYLRSETVTTPALLGMIIGWVVMSYVPGEFRLVGEALLVVALAAMAFTIIKGRMR